jgi:Fe2+ transport system protein FeoA
MKNLYEIDINQVATIIKLDNHPNCKLRLAEMGVMPGINIRLVKKTPLGGPVQVKINNYYLTLRKEDASLIYLEIVQS